MTLDENSPLDEALLDYLLQADAAVAEGGLPRARGISETHDSLGSDGLDGYVDLLRRLGHRGTSPEPSPESKTPGRLGRFEILDTLGQGGYGIVYLAFDPTLGRHVALKVPRPEVVMSPEVRRRFLREARAAAGLDHPNLVPVHEAGEVGPFCYIASAYCPGETLASWLKSQAEPVRPDAAARVIALLCDAVQHAHGRGILHRDIKPSNVILSGSEALAPSHRRDATHGGPSPPRLTDFGMAKFLAETCEETRTGMPLGSPPYMAPEQAEGRNRDVSPATDVYGLGATLYELLTGRPPFRGETTTETLRMVIESDCVPPRALRPGLPRDLETICQKCLMKDPSRRYPTAKELGDDLRRYLNREPVRARPLSVGQRISKWARRRPAHAAALAIAATMVLGLFAGLVHRHALVRRHARELEREVLRVDASERLARRHLRAFELRQARAAIDAGQFERAQDLLRGIQAGGAIPASGSDRLGFAWDYLMSRARRHVLVLSDRRGERVSEVTLSPDGQILATGDDDGTIRLRDPNTGQTRRILIGHRQSILRLIFSSDGRRLGSLGREGEVQRSEVFFWDLPSGKLAGRLEEAPGSEVTEVSFDPSGRFLWEVTRVEGGSLRLGLWDLTAGVSRPHLIWSRPIRSGSPPISRDGHLVAIEEEPRSFVVRDVLGNERGRTGVLEREPIFATPSPDGRLLAIAVRPAAIHVWDLTRRRIRARFEGLGETPGRLSFSPDGRYLACDFRSGACAIRDLVGGMNFSIPAGVDPDLRVKTCFSPDSRLLARNVPTAAGRDQPIHIWQLDPWTRLASYPGVARLSEHYVFDQRSGSLFAAIGYEAIRWNHAAKSEAAQPAGHTDEAWSVAFSPDSKILASGSDDTDEPRTIKLWDVATGREVRGWYAGVGTVSALAFDPEGRVLASGHLMTPGEVRLWEPTTGRRLATLPGHADSVRTLAFSPDGTILATAGSDRTIRLWDTRTWTCRHKLTGHDDTVRHLSFSPGGTHLASAANDKTVKVWDVSSGIAGAHLPGLEKIASVSYAPNGQGLATADERGLITLWDPTWSSQHTTIDSDDDELRCLVFSPNGEALATAGTSREIRLWDPVTGQELLSLTGHKAKVNALAFSPDGTALASCSHDGAVRLWRSRP